MNRNTKISLLILFLLIVVILLTNHIAKASEIVYYCKGNKPPWGLDDIKVWVEVTCQYLPVVQR